MDQQSLMGRPTEETTRRPVTQNVRRTGVTGWNLAGWRAAFAAAALVTAIFAAAGEGKTLRHIF